MLSAVKPKQLNIISLCPRHDAYGWHFLTHDSHFSAFLHSISYILHILHMSGILCNFNSLNRLWIILRKTLQCQHSVFIWPVDSSSTFPCTSSPLSSASWWKRKYNTILWSSNMNCITPVELTFLFKKDRVHVTQIIIQHVFHICSNPVASIRHSLLYFI